MGFASSASAVRGHMFSAHNIVSPARQFVRKSICSCCLVQFHTLGRMKRHLQKVQRCFYYYLSKGECLAPVEFESVREQNAIERRALISCGRDPYFAECPAMRIPGPLSHF